MEQTRFAGWLNRLERLFGAGAPSREEVSSASSRLEASAPSLCFPLHLDQEDLLNSLHEHALRQKKSLTDRAILEGWDAVLERSVVAEVQTELAQLAAHVLSEVKVVRRQISGRARGWRWLRFGGRHHRIGRLHQHTNATLRRAHMCQRSLDQAAVDCLEVYAVAHQRMSVYRAWLGYRTEGQDDKLVYLADLQRDRLACDILKKRTEEMESLTEKIRSGCGELARRLQCRQREYSAIVAEDRLHRLADNFLSGSGRVAKSVNVAPSLALLTRAGQELGTLQESNSEPLIAMGLEYDSLMKEFRGLAKRFVQLRDEIDWGSCAGEPTENVALVDSAARALRN